MTKPSSTSKTEIFPLILDSVYFKKGKCVLLKNISFCLEAGRRTVILGPNGAGKSLLMRICHGILQPTDGTADWASSNAIKKQAMVFQRPVLLRRNARANVDYALRLRSIAKAERQRRTNDVIKKTGLIGRKFLHAHSLSAGEQQRLALARAWATQPEVLFLDEPTANLDPSATHEVENIIKDIFKSGTCILMSTHDLLQAKRLADDIMFLHKGNLLEYSSAENFFIKPRSEEARQFLDGKLLWN